MPPRRKIEVLRDLDTIERRIRSNRKTARDSPSRKSADISDATLPALERRAEALRAEAEGALDETPKPASKLPAPTSIEWGPVRTTLLTEEELKGLEIPDFLKRV